MERLANLYCKGLNVLTALALLAMVLLVFGNVVLRYAFNSSIMVSEELSRWLFVWITFMGAVIALRQHGHLGTNLLIDRLPPMGRKLCFLAAHGAMLFVCWLVFKGALQQTRINADVLAPTTQWPMSIVYSAGLVFAVSAAGMLLLDVWLMLTGRLGNRDLVTIQQPEDAAARMRAVQEAAVPGPEHDHAAKPPAHEPRP